MKIYTKTGDKGNTSLFGGTIVPKDHLRIESYGTVDELNSSLALVIEHLSEDIAFKDQLYRIQHLLFNIGSNLAMDPNNKFDLPCVDDHDIEFLEHQMDEWNESLPELKSFILPGGNKSNAFAHLARTICRRAERRVVALSNVEDLDNVIIRYLNRLSDYLFVLCRWISHMDNVDEVKWTSS